MTYNPRRQAMPRQRPVPRTPPRITAWDVAGLLAITAIGAWVLYQISAGLLLLTYAGASR